MPDRPKVNLTPEDLDVVRRLVERFNTGPGRHPRYLRFDRARVAASAEKDQDRCLTARPSMASI